MPSPPFPTPASYLLALLGEEGLGSTKGIVKHDSPGDLLWLSDCISGIFNTWCPYPWLFSQCCCLSWRSGTRFPCCVLSLVPCCHLVAKD